LPETLAVPTVVPPDVHDAGGEECGPKTMKVTVPVGADPPASVDEIEAPGISVPAAPLAGALVETVASTGEAVTSRPLLTVALVA
jgi:hypothetical protein